MAKVYVAGKNLLRAKSVMDMLRENGHIITFDWLIGIENEPQDSTHKAILEREGVKTADALVYLWEADQESARYEAGMAMGLEKKVIISGTHNSFFFQLPEVVSVHSDDKILNELK